MLEARAAAEKIWYPVVWEELKDAKNVIDYDIRSEETKDTAAMINANNQTTTGMANVIPWVNAPKLIEGTSIISTPVPWYIYTVVNFRWAYINEGTESLIPSLSDQIWEPPFTTQWVNNRFLRMPAAWVYKIHITYPNLNTPRYWVMYNFFSDEKWQIDSVYPWGDDVDKDYTLQFKKGELLSATGRVIKIDSTWTGTVSPYFYWTITRLW